MSGLKTVYVFIRALLQKKLEIAAENLALRQQLAVQQRSGKRPRLRRRDRIFWVWLSRLWPGWQAALLIVKPDTVVRWHRQGINGPIFWCCLPMTSAWIRWAATMPHVRLKRRAWIVWRSGGSGLPTGL